MEKFSVLISVYAREKSDYLQQALDSVLCQSCAPSEIVLVKDGLLTPDLDRVIDNFKMRCDTLKVVCLAQNVGLGKALNIGLMHCSHELVARMDSDDISLGDRFEKQLIAFEKHTDVSIVGGWISEFESNPNQIISCRKLPENNEELVRFFRSRSPFNHVTVMFRKSDVLAAGGYQHFYLLEDYWLWARMIKNGARLYNIQQTLVNVRGGTQMAIRRGGWKYARSEVKFQVKLLKMNLIGVGMFSKNVAIRFLVRIMPSKIRGGVYKYLLRK